MSEVLVRIRSLRPATEAERSGVYHVASGPVERTLELLPYGGFVEHVHQPIQTLYDYPRSPEIPIYEDPLLECEDCAQQFSVSQLETDGDDDGYTESKCPHCGSWHACTLRYEKIAEFKARTGVT